MDCLGAKELLFGEVRSAAGEGSKDRTTVKRDMETILPMKNLANHNSIGSGFDFDFGKFIIVGVKIR